MGFMDSYKSVEKLCSEILDDRQGVTAYINEMYNNPNGSLYAASWDEDLKKLKYYRWVRNQISHVPECNEENMCKIEDEKWLNAFYYRMMNCEDSLCLYYKAINKQRKSKNPAGNYYKRFAYNNSNKNNDFTFLEKALFVVAVALIFFLIFKMIIR